MIVALLIFPKVRPEAPLTGCLGARGVSQVQNDLLRASPGCIQERRQAIPQSWLRLRPNWRRPAQAMALSAVGLARNLLLLSQLAQLEVQTHLGQTDYTFVVEGWAPESRLEQIRAALRREVGEEVLLIELPLSAAEQEQAPVLFANPRLVTPFEPLLGLLALPRYGEFDPSPLMALFFPLFFGMILGDVAYGFVLLALMIYLRWRFRAALPVHWAKR